MFNIKRNGRLVMDDAAGKPRQFGTRDEAHSWAELSHYGRYGNNYTIEKAKT